MERDSYSYSYSYSLHELQHHLPQLSPYGERGLLRAPPHLSLLRHSAPPQPPLLPLPATLPRRSSSCPARKPTKKKSAKSLTKNNNINTTFPQKEENKKTPKVSSTTVKDDRVPVFAISPPPSSLPLPSFCLRPKLSCNAAAADDLRRFLRLQ